VIQRLFQNKKGQGLVEYGLLIAGVALICAAGISLFGHKTCDLIAAVGVVLPCAHGDDNGPMVAGKLIETTGAGSGAIALDAATIESNSGEPRLGDNVGLDTPADFGGLIVEAS